MISFRVIKWRELATRGVNREFRLYRKCNASDNLAPVAQWIEHRFPKRVDACTLNHSRHGRNKGLPHFRPSAENAQKRTKTGVSGVTDTRNLPPIGTEDVFRPCSLPWRGCRRTAQAVRGAARCGHGSTSSMMGPAAATSPHVPQERRVRRWSMFPARPCFHRRRTAMPPVAPLRSTPLIASRPWRRFAIPRDGSRPARPDGRCLCPCRRCPRCSSRWSAAASRRRRRPMPQASAITRPCATRCNTPAVTLAKSPQVARSPLGRLVGQGRDRFLDSVKTDGRSRLWQRR